MATALAVPKTNITERYLEPWERKNYTLQQEHKMCCDWAKHFSITRNLHVAAQYYDKALELEPENPKALYSRCVFRRKIAHTQEALKDAMKANDLKPYQPKYHLEIGDALYELNEFENALVEFYNDKKNYHGSVSKEFDDRIELINHQLKDSFEDSLARFMLKNRQHVCSVTEMIKRENTIDKRLLWKRLRDEEKCDVLSILHKEKELLSPREKARRDSSFSIFHKTYFERNCADIIFLRNLRRNNEWKLKHFTVSTPILTNIVESRYKILNKFSKMLQARCPMYHKNTFKFPNQKDPGLLKERFLNEVQYKTRRSMITILRQINELHKKGKVETLAKYIESVMGDYVVLKTYRVMPWKFEFMNDVYNTLAIALADRYTANKTVIKSSYEEHELLLLLQMPKEPPFGYRFGNKSTWLSMDIYNSKYKNYKNFVGRLEKRILFARYSIEKTYLWHEIARAHLKQCQFYEACRCAKKSIEESNKCNNNLWEFLSQMLIVKSHAALQKIERCEEALQEAYVISKKLKSENLCLFVENARQINDKYIVAKQKARSAEAVRKHRSTSLVSVSE